jgi:hypothetical protein
MYMNSVCTVVKAYIRSISDMQTVRHFEVVYDKFDVVGIYVT